MGGYGATVNATSDTDGLMNTQIIVNTLGNNGVIPYAAQLCSESTEGGYTDWFLPSKDQLACLYQNQTLIGNFVTSPLAASRYWASTVGNDIVAFNIIFNNGTEGFNFKDTTTDRVRCVRAYNP